MSVCTYCAIDAHDRCIGRRCRCAAGGHAESRLEFAKEVTRSRGSRVVEHGTLNGYTNHGCRCEAGRAAAAAYQRAYREANKDEIAAYQRAYREANKDEIAAYQRAYREANKDEIAEKQRAYYEANKDEIAEKKRAYREANKDEIAEKKRAYYEANKDEIAAKQRAYYEANKDEIAAKQRAYREANKPTGPLVRTCTVCGDEFEQERRQAHPFMRCEACRDS